MVVGAAGDTSCVALLWFLTFGVIEKPVSLAGLVTVAVVIAAVKIGAAPPAAQILPALPKGRSAEYAFLAVSIIGAIITLQTLPRFGHESQFSL